MPSVTLPAIHCRVPFERTFPVTGTFPVIIQPVAVDPSGGLVPPVVAAIRLIGILGQTQTVSGTPSNNSGTPSNNSGTPSNNSGTPSNKRDPLGELVSVNMELAGLRGQTVFLSWSIFQEGGHTSLFGKWLNNFVAYRLEATTNDDTGSLEMWIPLPKLPGPFFIQLSLTTDGASIASTDSSPFD